MATKSSFNLNVMKKVFGIWARVHDAGLQPGALANEAFLINPFQENLHFARVPPPRQIFPSNAKMRVFLGK